MFKERLPCVPAYFLCIALSAFIADVFGSAFDLNRLQLGIIVLPICAVLFALTFAIERARAKERK